MFVQILGKKIKKPSANLEAFCYSLYSGGPNDGFLDPNALKTLFETLQSTFRPLKCILSGAIQFASVRSS